jgi:TldD protein
MKRLFFYSTSLAALSGAAWMLAAQAPASASNSLLQAMHDEVERARKLTLNNLEPPYFVQFGMDESETFEVSAMLGGVLSKRHDRFRSPEVRVRVGDYTFDNTNYTGGGGFGSRYDLGRFPLENSYPVLRRYFWLEADSAYKAAVEAVSRKRAALRNITQSDKLNDFAHAEPVHRIRDFQGLAMDEDAWTDRVRALSAVFTKYPGIRSSTVELEASNGGYTMVNSEGSEMREPENVVVVRARATALAPDGMTVHDAVSFHAVDASRLPTQAEMDRGVAGMAEKILALTHAPKGEDYNGPVLFEGQAGAQVFAEVLGRNLALTRRPVAEGNRGSGVPPSEFEGRMGSRVLPDTFDVVDDPTQKEWRGRALFGSYEVDREGVVAKPLRLVEKGVLKSYLMTRQPVHGFEGSNGRARLPGSYGAAYPTFSNLFVSTSESVPAADLKKKLIEMIQAREKPYGILVRRMDFPSSGSVDDARRLLAASQGSARPVSMPVLVYRVYPDGHEELVRGMRFRGFNARSLRDIVAAGDDSNLFEFMDSPAPFALIGAASFTTESCVVAPSILIDDLELHPVEDELPKLPLVPAPEITR